VFRFRNVSAPNGKEADGQTFHVSAKPIPVLAKSRVNQLDFVLMEMEPAIKSRPDIWKASVSTEVPYRGMPLNIFQHAQGGPLSIAFSKDGVRHVLEKRGLVQYATAASGGSSGSPCLSDEWKVVALHHAERATSFGSIREGVLMSTIYPLIRTFID
jgi:endonuclease G